MKQSNQPQREPRPEADFHGALIDERGREIPITEAMILRACQILEKSWRSPWASLSQDA